MYGHTLAVPFYLDDFSSIIENPVIYGDGGLSGLWDYTHLRIVGYLTFLFNFNLHHANPAGYHVINIFIHFLAGLSVFALTCGLLLTPAMAGRSSSLAQKYLPLFTALLFVVHPLQTQAVTYIVQRLASLAALWSIASLGCYVHARISESNGKKYLLFLVSFLCVGLGFFTKQNTFVLPLLLVVLELVFFPATRKNTARIVLGATVAGVLLLAVLSFFIEPLSLRSLDAATRETSSISRSAYFLTQLEVVWTYIRMFFWPSGLHIEHGVVLASGFSGSVVVALLGHLAVLAGAVFAIRRFPVFAFGILLYYISHLVESSVIPIRDLLFEHRTYLPNVGLCLSGGWVLFALPVKQQAGRMAVSAMAVCILLIGGVWAWQRNEVWRDPVALWRDAAIHAPMRARPWNEFGKYLLEQGRNQEAIAVFRDTIARIGGNEVSPGLYMEETSAVNLMMALAKEGKKEAALQIADDFVTRDVKPINKSKMLTNKGNLLFQDRQFDRAEESYRQAIEVFDTNVAPMNNLGILLMKQGRLDEAEQMFVRVLSIDPNFRQSRAMLNKLRRR